MQSLQLILVGPFLISTTGDYEVMSSSIKIRPSLRRYANLLMVAVMLGLSGAVAVAQQVEAGAKVEPVFREYKGVHLGMSADEARQKLGKSQEQSDQQDFYVFSENEVAQVFYTENKVFAISVMFTGEQSGAPTPNAVFGGAVDPKADGSVYKMIRYPKAGCWISYSRSAGESPVVTVTMQKLSPTQP